MSPNPLTNLTPAIKRIYQRADREAAQQQHAAEIAHFLANVRRLKDAVRREAAADTAARIKEQQQTPEGRMRSQYEREAETQRQLAADQQEQSRHERWAAARPALQAAREAFRREAVLSGRSVEFSKLPPDYPLEPPAQWGIVDTGVAKVHFAESPDDDVRPVDPLNVERDTGAPRWHSAVRLRKTRRGPSGAIEGQLTANPITGRPLNAPEIPLTPNQVFGDA